MKPKIKIAFASGTDDLNARLTARMREIFPELPLYVVSDFPPADRDVQWVPYHQHGGLENWSRCRAAFRGKKIRLAGALLVPNVPFRAMRLLALMLSPLYFLAINENFNEFMLRPASIPTMARHAVWRLRNFVRWHLDSFRRRNLSADIAWLKARTAGMLPRPRLPEAPLPESTLQPGLSILCSSREALPELSAFGPAVEILEVASHTSARINDAITAARYSRICLVDHQVQPALVQDLLRALDRLPELFSASAEPCGVQPRRQGSGFSYAVHGGGCCTVYDTARLRALGGMDAAFETRTVPHLDLGYRAWQRGWPSITVPASAAGSLCDSEPPCAYRAELAGPRPEAERLVFLARAISDPVVFRTQWRGALQSLRERASDPSALATLRDASGLPRQGVRTAATPVVSDAAILALTDGAVTVYPGRAPSGRPCVVVASAYVPFPLSHGGAVRMENLTRRAAADFDQVLIAFTENSEPPPREILDRFVEVVLVYRAGSHAVRSNGRPEVVAQFDSPAYRAALRQAVRKWHPAIVQLEFTQMAQYAGDCAPARTILVEHDITFDLYQQLLALGEDWDLRRQVEKWRRFETGIWSSISRVVTMSEKDRALVAGAEAAGLSNAAIIPNGVDLDRYRPAATPPEDRRLLFIGSFSHLPNLLAAEFFLKQVWPLLHDVRLHIIAGARHEYFLEYQRQRVQLPLDQPGVEVEGFVADVRPAYGRAAVVVAPLIASAGTNLKILEAMACARPVVSTPEGVNGLDLVPGEDFLLVHDAREMAAAIERLLADPEERRRIAVAGQRRVEDHYGWDNIAARQADLYRELLNPDAR